MKPEEKQIGWAEQNHGKGFMKRQNDNINGNAWIKANKKNMRGKIFQRGSRNVPLTKSSENQTNKKAPHNKKESCSYPTSGIFNTKKMSLLGIFSSAQVWEYHSHIAVNWFYFAPAFSGPFTIPQQHSPNNVITLGQFLRGRINLMKNQTKPNCTP